MPSFWILKTDTDTYPFARLEREGRTVWDGVSNALALKHIRAMAPGDRLLIYHSGDEKALVGLARVVSAPYADPKGKDSKLTVVDIEAGARLPRPVSLAAIKADPAFRDLALVRMSRLSVVPVPAAQWTRLLDMAGLPASARAAQS
jgi:predicted RNA-binding protein with PUA-like domain